MLPYRRAALPMIGVNTFNPCGKPIRMVLTSITMEGCHAERGGYEMV